MLIDHTNTNANTKKTIYLTTSQVKALYMPKNLLNRVPISSDCISRL